MNKNIKYYFSKLSKLLLFWQDTRCQYCKKNIQKNSYNTVFCTTCLSKISYQSISLHNKQYPVYALGKYDGILRSIVTAKYKAQSIVYHGIADKITYIFDLFSIQFDIIVYIPKKFINNIKQKYNSSYIIAMIINQKYKKYIFNNLFYRYPQTSQSGKSITDRKKLKNDIYIIPTSEKANLINKTILIVDDVYTSGKTIDAAINILHTCKPKNIIIFVIAKK